MSMFLERTIFYLVIFGKCFVLLRRELFVAPQTLLYFTKHKGKKNAAEYCFAIESDFSVL